MWYYNIVSNSLIWQWFCVICYITMMLQKPVGGLLGDFNSSRIYNNNKIPVWFSARGVDKMSRLTDALRTQKQGNIMNNTVYNNLRSK